jgi:hypothetical protein
LIRRRLAILAFALSLTPNSALAALPPLNAQVQYLIASFDPVTLTGSGVGTSIGGGIATLPAGLFAGNPAVFVPIAPTLLGLGALSVPAGIAGNAAGAFAPGGAMGLAGSVYFFGTDNLGNLSIVGSVSLAPIGGGGNAAGYIGPLNLTLEGVTWMGGTAVFSAMSAALAIPFSVAATAFDNRTANGAGTLQLVAPTRANLGVFGFAPVFGVLTLTYTPEPGTLTLLGAGVAALAMIGRRKLEERG